MHDFTKEELNLLLDGLSDCVNEIDQCSESIHAVIHSILNKLKYKIDNYCDHEWNYNQHGIGIECMKCGKSYR